MATIFDSPRYQQSLLTSSCSMSAPVAVFRAKEGRLKEEKFCWRECRLVRFMESTSIHSQIIIGSTAGLISGFLAKAAGKGWATAVGTTLFAIRMAGHIANRSTPVSICGCTQGEMNIIEHIIDETVTFMDRNIFVVTGFVGGYFAVIYLTESADS